MTGGHLYFMKFGCLWDFQKYIQQAIYYINISQTSVGEPSYSQSSWFPDYYSFQNHLLSPRVTEMSHKLFFISWDYSII